MALRRSGERRTGRAVSVAAMCSALIASGCAAATEPAPPDLGTTVKEAYEYAFPLYELSRHRWNALETPGSRTATTPNAFAHSRSLPGPDDTWANGPSEDVLYSTAWLDLARGPVHLDTPDTGDRFYVLTLIDFYFNTFFYAGLVANPDGSIDIAVQATEPAQQTANWLPSPSNGKNFILFARSYVPGPEVLAGKFTMPPVTPR
ncbi:DUF1254 domain-containing protein [Saccharopolyspora shandongensis]|uniref:DUF1254 domain-containing protein n=1 Tax=Saccharopolyspora shandongensis TaxID=418495 RepID=UPI00340C504C